MRHSRGGEHRASAPAAAQLFRSEALLSPAGFCGAGGGGEEEGSSCWGLVCAQSGSELHVELNPQPRPHGFCEGVSMQRALCPLSHLSAAVGWGCCQVGVPGQLSGPTLGRLETILPCSWFRPHGSARQSPGRGCRSALGGARGSGVSGLHLSNGFSIQLCKLRQVT